MTIYIVSSPVFLFMYLSIKNYTTKCLTYIPLMLDPRRGSKGVSDIPPRRVRFTRMTSSSSAY
jgi:hypothetical protein